MGTDANNVLDNLEELIEHIEYFATCKGYTIDQTKLDEYATNLIKLVNEIDGSKK